MQLNIFYFIILCTNSLPFFTAAWANYGLGMRFIRAQSGCMSKREIQLAQFDEIKAFEKKDLAIRNAFVRKLSRLVARHNALRIVKRANVGKAIAPKLRRK